MIPAIDTVRGAALVARAAHLQGVSAERIAGLDARPVSTTALTIPSRHGDLRARLYAPGQTWRRTVVLTPGVHSQGLDEPRLVEFARHIATAGIGVVAIELPDLLAYSITPRLPDQIEDAAAWVLANRRYARDGRVGLFGISFAGGLSVIAAGRERIRDRVSAVMAFGGHSDLKRTLRYLCTGLQADGTYRQPHDYGLVVVLLNAVPVLVPSDQVEGLTQGLLAFMKASHLAMFDQARAASVHAEAVSREATLPEPARGLLHAVNTRDVDTIGRVLLPVIESAALPASVSPEQSPPPAAPVFLLHGADDNVVPAIESRRLAETLVRQGVETRLYVTSLVTHAEVDRPPTASEVWQMVRFWASLTAR